MKSRTAIAVLLALTCAFAVAEKKNDEQFADLKFTVVKEETGAPVRNASVVLHPLSKDGKQARWGKQLKTDSEGKAELDGVPFGKLRIQVIARGMQTFGEDYEINEGTREIVIKLKPPQEQYSIYK